MRRAGPLCKAGLVGGSAAIFMHTALAADTRQKTRTHSRHAAGTAVAATTPPAPPAENLVVHGQRRFTAAPMPNQDIHDPADALRDPATGAPIGKFGRAYLDADPAPPVNPELNGDQSPVQVGIRR